MYLLEEQHKSEKHLIRNKLIIIGFSLLLPLSFPHPALAADSVVSQIIEENPEMDPIIKNPELIFDYIRNHKGEKYKIVTEETKTERQLPDLNNIKDGALQILRESWWNLGIIAALWGWGKKREIEREKNSIKDDTQTKDQEPSEHPAPLENADFDEIKDT